jgi:anti-sigma factor RsiW
MSACSDQWNERLSALVDAELSPLEARLTAAHLQHCALCAGTQGDYLKLRKLLEPARVPAPPVPSRSRRAPLAFALATLAAAAALLLALPHGLDDWMARPRGLNDALAAEVEQHHFRAFAGASPCEFSSADPEKVRAWLDRAVGYDVEVPQVPGATLLGARRCKLHGVPTAALLYRKGAAGLTLFLPLRYSRAGSEASRFGDSGGRCTTGRLGESICALHGRRGATLAVSDAPADAVLAAARAAVR